MTRSQEKRTAGQKGGTGANAGKKSSLYRVTFSDGSTTDKRVFNATADELIATAFRHDGSVHVAVWPGEPAWEGDFGRLVAKRVKT